VRTPSVPFSPHAIAALCLTLTLGACGGGDITLPPDGAPASIQILDGDGQTGKVGLPLTNPLVVGVFDARGRPVAGATVIFEFSQAGPDAAVVPAEKTTNSDGVADAQLVLGTTVGTQIGQVRVAVPEGRAPILAPFTAEALSENANTMAAAGGLDQTGHVSRPLDDRLVVVVTDGFGNPVPGVPITWTAMGGGTVSEGVVPTDADGRSRVDRTLGPAVGQQSTEARADGLAGSPVIFTHTAVAGDASRLLVVSGSGQSALAGTLLPEDLVVRLVDAEGNGVPNTAVTWVIANGGGSVGPQNTITDGDGRASAQWTLGPALGEQRADAVVSGVGVATFRATAASAAPPSLFIRTQPSAVARNGVPLGRQPVVQLHDGAGNDVSTAGIEVIVSLGGGGELGGTLRRTTDATGRATFDDLFISGEPGPRTLVFQAIGYAQVTSDEIALQAIGTTTTITDDTPDPSVAGGTVTVSFRVASDGPIPTGTVTVSDGVQSCTGTLSNGVGSCTLDLTTVGARILTATYNGGPGLNGSSGTEGHTVTGTQPPPPAATTTTITDDTPDPSVSGSTFTVRFSVTSAAGTPGGTVTVSVSGDGPTPSCTGTLDNGAGSCELQLVIPGDRTLTATYSGGAGFAPSSGTAPHRVDPQPAENHGPVADFNWNCQDLTCNFADNSRDDEGYETITARRWDFGDGTVIEGNALTLSHTYDTPGDRTVTLTVTDNGGLSDDSSDRVNPRSPAARSLSIREQPSSSVTIGDEFSRQPEIELRLGDDRLEQSGVTVTASIASGSGTLGGTVTAVTDGDGRAQFDDLSISGATGTHTLRFTADGFGEVISNPIEVEQESSQIQITSFDPDDPIVGQTVRVSFSVTGDGGTPTGNVTVTADGPGETCSGAVSQGFCDLVFTAPGNDRDVTATYEGDGRFEGDTDTAEIDVDPAPPVNQAPTANDDEATTDAGVAVTIPVRANDTDPEGTELTIGDVSSPANGGTAVNNGDGTITYTPADGFSGSDSFTYTASDGSLSDAATVTVTVNAPPAPGVLGLRTEPPPTVSSGQVLQPEPEVELLSASGDPLQVAGVTVSAVPVPADAATLGGTTSLTTDGNGRVRFDDLSIQANPGASVVLAFSADGFAEVDSQAIQIESN
jgi:hypothetical protein